MGKKGELPQHRLKQGQTAAVIVKLLDIQDTSRWRWRRLPLKEYAALADVSERLIERAIKVRAKSPDVFEELSRGDVTIVQAEKKVLLA